MFYIIYIMSNMVVLSKRVFSGIEKEILDDIKYVKTDFFNN